MGLLKKHSSKSVNYFCAHLKDAEEIRGFMTSKTELIKTIERIIKDVGISTVTHESGDD